MSPFAASKEIEERFYKDLEFGTAGLRGILGAGTNRMNVYTVRRATQGLADYIAQKGDDAKARGVAISYDCRHYSEEFAWESACVLAANGIRVFIFAEPGAVTNTCETPTIAGRSFHFNNFCAQVGEDSAGDRGGNKGCQFNNFDSG